MLFTTMCYTGVTLIQNQMNDVGHKIVFFNRFEIYQIYSMGHMLEKGMWVKKS